ncbi:MAG: LPS export ABC transporter permease LptF [Hyphomicrobiaceae bacterium]|nr:LPS export ABC transporter permease LptF [Hyphomicrobiaceae bacterium]
MPGILFRYVFRQAAGAVAMIMASLTGVVWIALALRQLNLITSQGQDTWLFIKMTMLALPNLMALVAPVALLVATIHTLNRLNGDSELIVMTAGGANTWTVARPLLVLALLVSLAVSLVNHLGMPWSLRLLRSYIVQVRTDLISQVIQPGRFSTPETNLTFHIRDRDGAGQILGLVMHDARDEKQISTYLAERGQIVKQDQSAYLLMDKGHILRRPQNGDPVQMIAFERYVVDLARFEPKETGIDLKPRERYYDELVSPADDDTIAKRQPGLLRAELHERLSSPLYPFAFVLVAVAFIGHARTTRQNRIQAIVAAFLLATGARLAGLAGTNVVALKASSTWIVYAIPLGAAALAMAMMAARRTLRPPSRLARQMSLRAGDAGQLLLRGLTAWRRVRQPSAG